MIVAISIWTCIKACFLKPKLEGSFYLTMMWIFVVLDVIDHLTDFINAFFLPHATWLTAFTITMGFLTPVCLVIHELVESDDWEKTIGAYFGIFEEASEDTDAAKELQSKIVRRKALFCCLENAL
jgi:hypothetical protein